MVVSRPIQEHARALHDDINPRRRVGGPGLQDVVGRLPTRRLFWRQA